MKKINIYILLLLCVCTFTAFAAPEAEYGILSKTYTLHADGSQEYRYNMELTLFTHTAMNRTYGESFIIYNPKYQEVKIHHSYTRQKDGTIIKTPDNALVEVLPRQAANAPAYNHLKELVVVHTGLELGATIFLDYSVLSKPGYLNELDIYEAVAQTSPVKEYTITLAVPENKPLNYTFLAGKVKPETSANNGMKQVSWKMRNLPAASMAPQTSSLSGDVPFLIASTYPSVTDALKVLQAQLTPSGDMPLLSLSETITEGKATDTEKLTAILHHVVNNVGLSRLSLAETGFRIRPTDDVIPSAFGTGAEKVNLLAGLLNAAGIPAEVVASFNKKADSNACGLSAAYELFVRASADGKQYLLTPSGTHMAQTGWLADYARCLSVSNPGKEVTLASPDMNLSAQYTLSLSDDKAGIKTTATVGNAHIPYTDNYKGRFTGNDKEAKEEKAANASTFIYTANQPLENRNGYILLSLPDLPASLSHAAYSRYNSSREDNLLLAARADESYRYTVQLPANMQLATPESSKNMDNSVGSAMLTVKQNGNTVEVSRLLKLKKQLITPADYTEFRNLMVEWSDMNNRSLLIKLK